MINLLNYDCMQYMATVPDKYFDLIVASPPVGRYMPMPSIEYFKEIARVSKNQIIWGANNYTDRLPFVSHCWLVWNKLSIDPNYNDCVLAWTSFNTPIRIFTHTFQTDNRIHPFQEPVELHDWILENYADHNFKILDTHLGSASSAIAAANFGIAEFVGTEINTAYYEAGLNRYYELQRCQQLNC